MGLEFFLNMRTLSNIALDSTKKKTLWAGQTADIHLDEHLWSEVHKVSENKSLTKPFSLEEVDFAIKETKKKHSTRSHGFSVEFFLRNSCRRSDYSLKRCWMTYIKGPWT